MADSQTLSLAAVGNFANSSGVDSVNLVGNEGAFLRDTTANDFLLRYAGRFNQGRSLVDAAVGFHTQRGSIAGGNRSSSLDDNSPLVTFDTTTHLLINISWVIQRARACSR